MANTQISYLYRDASNYKQFESVILEGELSENDIGIIIKKLVDGVLFIPEQVGLESLQQKFDDLNDDDHIYHELHREGIGLVEAPPTITLSAKELVRNFQNVNWDVNKAYWRLWSQWG